MAEMTDAERALLGHERCECGGWFWPDPGDEGINVGPHCMCDESWRQVSWEIAVGKSELVWEMIEGAEQPDWWKEWCAFHLQERGLWPTAPPDSNCGPALGEDYRRAECGYGERFDEHIRELNGLWRAGTGP